MPLKTVTKPKRKARRAHKAAGAVIAEIRQHAGLSQTALAKACRVRQNRVSDIEHSANLNWDTLCSVAERCKAPAVPDGFGHLWQPRHLIARLDALAAARGVTQIQAFESLLLATEKRSKTPRAESP